MRIIVVGDRLGEAGRDAMSNALALQPAVAWWHWFPDAWLIRDPQARSPEWWLRLFRECVPTGRILVLGDGPDHPWAAQGPPEFFSPWIDQFWRPDLKETLPMRYQKETLRGLLLRRLGREEDGELDRLDEIWYAMSPEEQQAADLWMRALPEPLRTNGPEVRDDWDRASGSAECPVCGLTYLDHPEDPREAFPLHVTCDGRRWKL